MTVKFVFKKTGTLIEKTNVSLLTPSAIVDRKKCYVCYFTNGFTCDFPYRDWELVCVKTEK